MLLLAALPGHRSDSAMPGTIDVRHHGLVRPLFRQHVHCRAQYSARHGAGARNCSGPARRSAKEINSTAPWTGFLVAHAVFGILLTTFGCCVMIRT